MDHDLYTSSLSDIYSTVENRLLLGEMPAISLIRTPQEVAFTSLGLPSRDTAISASISDYPRLEWNLFNKGEATTSMSTPWSLLKRGGWLGELSSLEEVDLDPKSNVETQPSTNKKKKKKKKSKNKDASNANKSKDEDALLDELAELNSLREEVKRLTFKNTYLEQDMRDLKDERDTEKRKRERQEMDWLRYQRMTEQRCSRFGEEIQKLVNLNDAKTKSIKILSYEKTELTRESLEERLRLTNKLDGTSIYSSKER